MPIGERFRKSEGQDPRITKLETVKRNFERTGYYGNEKFIIGLGYFGMLKEILELFPDFDIRGHGTDNEIPGLVWSLSRNDMYFLELSGLDIGTNSNNLLVRIMSYHSMNSSGYSREEAKEIVPKNELSQAILEDAIFRVFSATGHYPDEHDQKKAFKEEGGGHSPDADFDRLYRYHRILRLDPNAFRDLSKEEGDELLRAVFRFATKKYHPDRGGDNEAMRLMNEAKEFLDDPKNRIPKQ